MKKLMLVVTAFIVSVLAIAQNTGIGTSNPETKLHVADSITVSDGTDGAYINVQNKYSLGVNGILSGVRFRVDGVGTPVNSRYKGAIFFQKTGSWGVGSLHFVNNDDANNNSATAADARMTITSLGRVGIGTISPSSQLHVNSASSEVVRVQGANPYISLHDNTDGYRSYWWYNGTDVYLAAVNGDLRFSTNSSTRLRILSDGRVLVGAFSSVPATGYVLSVDGKAIAEEVRIQLSTGWPDYVFSDNYKLPSVAELEKYIAKNKHLPNMPSAAEVEKQNGFDLGDMQKRTLEKIEELTLYIIQLKKENEQLQKRIEVLEKK